MSDLVTVSSDMAATGTAGLHFVCNPRLCIAIGRPYNVIPDFPDSCIFRVCTAILAGAFSGRRDPAAKVIDSCN
jgi:hypothetical protein